MVWGNFLFCAIAGSKTGRAEQRRRVFLLEGGGPDHLINVRSGDEEENEAKRPRSTSTTPKSGRGRDPDDCDHFMGINSVDLSS